MLKKYLAFIAATVVLFAGFFVSHAEALTCASVYPSALDNYVAGDCIPSSWANAVEAYLGITGSTASSSLTYIVNNLSTSSIAGLQTYINSFGFVTSTPPNVASLNNATGTLTILGTGSTTVTTSGTTITINSTSSAGGGGGTSNNILYVPTNFASAGCNGSSTLTDFGGCVNALYASASSTTGVSIWATTNVSQAQWKTPITFNVNMVIPSLDCSSGVKLSYGGSGNAVNFNFNVSGAHDVSEDYGCTYLGASSVLSAGATNAATTTGITFGGTTGSNAANGINFHDNTINGFGTDVDVATNTYMIAFDNNAVSGGGSTANQPHPGSLLTINKASNSGERMVFSQNSFTDPANSTSNNAVYLSDNALASGFFTNNSFDDSSMYVGISNGEVDVNMNHFENPAYSTYLMHYFIIASSSGATNLNVNDNVFALDNTGGTGQLSELIEHAVNLVFNDNIVENYGGAGAITNCIDHSINAGQAIESFSNDWSQNSACSNWAQLSGTLYPSFNLENTNGFPLDITVDGGGNAQVWTGQADNFLFNTAGGFEVGGKLIAGGGTYITASTTVQATGTGASIRAGSPANASHGCYELYDSVNTSTLEYIYTTSGTLAATTTKPSFCQ